LAYVQQRKSTKGTRYRGFYKGADGRYRSAGTYDTNERALEVAEEAERRADELIGGVIGGLDPTTRATRTIEEYTPIFLRHHQIEGNTKDTYSDTLRLHINPFLGGCRLAETNRTVARNYVTALLEAGRPEAGMPRDCRSLAAPWAACSGALAYDGSAVSRSGCPVRVQRFFFGSRGRQATVVDVGGPGGHGVSSEAPGWRGGHEASSLLPSIPR
jgi:hypothetical protein